jgi:hypothetical protein
VVWDPLSHCALAHAQRVAAVLAAAATACACACAGHIAVLRDTRQHLPTHTHR